MESKLDVRDLVYMIKDNENKYILSDACYENKSLAEFIMEIKYNNYWIETGKVEVIQVPIKFLRGN